MFATVKCVCHFNEQQLLELCNVELQMQGSTLIHTVGDMMYVNISKHGWK